MTTFKINCNNHSDLSALAPKIIIIQYCVGDFVDEFGYTDRQHSINRCANLKCSSDIMHVLVQTSNDDII